MNLSHGGDVAGYRIRFGRAPLDFSASLNPLGMPRAVRDAARDAVDVSIAYPDPLCRELVAALAKRLNVSGSCVFCGNGAADVIFRLVQSLRPRTAMVTAPTFSEYELALRTVGCGTERYVLKPENGFALDGGILSRIASGLEILFLCQPNNPTSRLAEPELMRAILERCVASGTLLFVDESFCRFVDEPERYSLLPLLNQYPNLFILDSFTKLYGMAGIRLGYGVSSDRKLIGKIRGGGQPWTVSTIAQAAGVAALGEEAFVETSRRFIRREKRELVDALEKLRVEVFGFEANYIFFRSSVVDLAQRLAKEGIMIRNCGNFQGLEPGYYRVCVRLEDENRRLVEAMAMTLGFPDASRYGGATP